MSLAFGFSGIRSRGDVVVLGPVVASGYGVSVWASVGPGVVPGSSVVLVLVGLAGLTGSAVGVPRLASGVGLVGSGSSIGVAGGLVGAVSWFVDLSV